MANPSEDTEVKVATSAAQDFVDAYYPAVNNAKGSGGRSSIPSFYIKPSANSPVEADISLNGNVVASPDEVRTIFENQVSRCHYEVQSFDCEVLNSNYNVSVDDAKLGPDKDGKKMSILVLVSGSVRYWKDGGDGEVRGFTETFVLVPNWEAHNPKAPKGDRRWLIQSQTFRIVL